MEKVNKSKVVRDHLSRYPRVLKRYSRLKLMPSNAQKLEEQLYRFITANEASDILIQESEFNSIIDDAKKGNVVDVDNDKQYLRI